MLLVEPFLLLLLLLSHLHICSEDDEDDPTEEEWNGRWLSNIARGSLTAFMEDDVSLNDRKILSFFFNLCLCPLCCF